MCDCDKTRKPADTTHLTYASVIKRNPCVPSAVGSVENKIFFLRRKTK